MQFQIPQFIEVEDKIFGPFTFKQFIFIGGGLGSAYLVYRILPVLLALPIIGVIGAFTISLAFLQFNGRPFIIALEHGFFYFLHPKLYLWDNDRKRIIASAKKKTEDKTAEVYVPKLSDSRLHELAWSLDIKERISGGYASDDERATGGGVVSPVSTMRDIMSGRN